MNKNKNIFVLLSIGVIILFMISCSQQSVSLGDNQYNFSVVGVYFENQQIVINHDGIFLNSNSWDHYKSIGVNTFYLEADTEPHVSGEPVVISRNLPLNYDSNNTPYVDINKDADYTIEGNGTWWDSSTIKFTTHFKDATGGTVDTVDDREEIRNKTDNDITLTYLTSSQPAINMSISKSEKGVWGWVDGALKYSNINCHTIHDATNNNGHKDGNINIIVMAEGYRADQMYKYEEYVRDAFANPANFHYIHRSDAFGHYHVINDFFNKYWNRINVIRMDTISPHEGIDHDWMVDRIQSILNLNSDGRSSLTRGDYSRIKTIIDNNKPKDISYIDVDAVIIFVNDPDIWAYTTSYDGEIGKRNYQPINAVVIQAPIGYDVSANDFHDYVKTDAIAHELGHALARLQDEYLNDEKSKEYKTHFRNIEDDTTNDNYIKYKWLWFIENGYNVSAFEGALLKDWYFRATDNSTMRSGGLNVQFGAVNTYHLTATFKIRMMDKYTYYETMREPKQEWEYYNPINPNSYYVRIVVG